jgi:hypothetical protein|tara:strand:- start:47 stop:736 length:690 start_codon:yes stop_codon:yes gene_type:complete
MLGISAGLSNVKSMKATSSAWDVTKISGLFAWFKYNENQTTAAGDQLTRWGDHYGSEALTVHAGKVLTNGGDLDFDTNNGRMILESVWQPGSFSFYFVARTGPGDISNDEVFQSNSSNFFRINNSTQVRIRIGDTTNNDITLPGDELIEETWFVIGVEWDGTTISVYQDSDYATPTTSDDSGEFAGIEKIGKRDNPFDGQIREIVMVNNELSDDDRDKLMTHLKEIRDS